MTDNSDIWNYDVTRVDPEKIEFNGETPDEPITVLDVTYSIGDVEQDVGTFLFKTVDELHDIWEHIGENESSIRDESHRGEVFVAIILNYHGCYAIKTTVGDDKNTDFLVNTGPGEHVHLTGPDLTIEDCKRFKQLSQDFDDQSRGSSFFEDEDSIFPIINTGTAYERLATYYWDRANYEQMYYSHCDDPVRDGLKTLWVKRAQNAMETAEELGDIQI